LQTIVMDIQQSKSHIALLHKGKLIEHTQNHARDIQGNIYLAKVEKVSKTFAFLDIGLPQRAFIKLKEEEKLKGGQTLVVQVKKNGTTSSEIVNDDRNIEQKGPVVTKNTSFPQKDMGDTPKLLYSENATEPYKSTLLALLAQGGIDQIIINNESHLDRIAKMSASYNLKPKLFLGDIFAQYEVQHQIDALHHKKVWLKCGGYIVIEKTSALTVIDVNTGKYTSKRTDTAIKTNKEATEEIAKQLRLRNITGIIVVDFINVKNSEPLLDHLRDEIKKDRTPTTVVGITPLGLVEITRKRGK